MPNIFYQSSKKQTCAPDEAHEVIIRGVRSSHAVEALKQCNPSLIRVIQIADVVLTKRVKARLEKFSNVRVFVFARSSRPFLHRQETMLLNHLLRFFQNLVSLEFFLEHELEEWPPRLVHLSSTCSSRTALPPGPPPAQMTDLCLFNCSIETQQNVTRYSMPNLTKLLVVHEEPGYIPRENLASLLPNLRELYVPSAWDVHRFVSRLLHLQELEIRGTIHSWAPIVESCTAHRSLRLVNGFPESQDSSDLTPIHVRLVNILQRLHTERARYMTLLLCLQLHSHTSDFLKLPKELFRHLATFFSTEYENSLLNDA